MAVARVKIAPLDNWCENYRNLPKELVGLEIAIETSSLDSNPERFGCGGRFWNVDELTGNRLRELCGLAPITAPDITIICEHMLEMD